MGSGDGPLVVIRAGARSLKRELGPLVWAVLEDVALEARPDGAGRHLAATSSRTVAEHLGLAPGTAAKALARLRSLGLVDHARQAGESGRFGLSVYVLGDVPGLEVVGGDDRPGAARPEPSAPTPPRTATPRPAAPRTTAPRTEAPRTEAPRTARRHTVEGDSEGAGSPAPAPAGDYDQLDLLHIELPSKDRSQR